MKHSCVLAGNPSTGTVLILNNHYLVSHLSSRNI
jgi:hypothetical protein